MLDDTDLLQYLGQRLIERGFKDWFLFLFNKIEGTRFIQEELHKDLFDFFEDIYNGKKPRAVLNLPPRSAKTTISQYFVVWCITNNPKSNIIYTSFSQQLLGTIAQHIMEILEHPLYRAMYPHRLYQELESEDLPVNDFWLEYNQQENKKNTYSTKKITTYAGGVILFSAMGSSITGFGAGLRNSKKFGGILILDDPNKPQDIRYKRLRQKVCEYFEETLLSRVNNSQVPVLCVQQRLHKYDLSGFLIEKYKYEVLKKPLLDSNGNCTLPSQYTAERIAELQKNNYMFQAQYQAEPIAENGNLIKRDWFTYYTPQDITLNRYKKIVIAWDTAISVKESADYSCGLVGGVTTEGKLHILEMIHGRYEYPELKQVAVNLFNKYQFDIYHTSCTAVYIENKASGQQLIQELRGKTGMPVIPIEVNKDKLARVEEVLEYMQSGNVMLPVDENYGFNNLLLSELEEFNREQTQEHDDITDALVHLINNTIAHKRATIFEVL
jgi:predicted phage terminase large subunit-like protein